MNVRLARGTLCLAATCGLALAPLAQASYSVHSPTVTAGEYKWKPAFSPLIEAYGKPVGRTGDWGRPRNLLGPGFKSKFHFGNERELEFGMVLLFGLSGAAADTTLVARLEYAFF